MGKRELLIAAGFIVLAAIAYQFTAPAPKEGEHGFSLSRIFEGFKREMRADSATADFTQSGVIPVGAAVEELRLNTFRSVAVTVEGEDRRDISYEMPVHSTGPDAASALEYAKKSVLEVDDLGAQITIGTFFPPEGSQTASLTLKVPARLSVRIEGGGRPKIRGVAALHLGRTSGELLAENIRGTVAGTHQSGDLTVRKAGRLDLILIGTRARFSEIQLGLTVNARSGECDVTASRGPLDFTSTNAKLTIAGHDGLIEIGGDGGQIRLDRPTNPVRIDIRRTAIEVTLAAAVVMTILTSDQPLRLILDGPPAVEVDAIANNAAIEAEDFGLQAERSERAARLTHAFGGKAARITLRNSRGDIVLAKVK